MRILLYLAALAIFLIIVNLGSRWLGTDSSVEAETAAITTDATSTAEPATEALVAESPVVETPAASIAVEDTTLDQGATSAANDTAAAPALVIENAPALAAVSTTSARPGPEPGIGGAMKAKPPTPPATNPTVAAAVTETIVEAAPAQAVQAAPKPAVQETAPQQAVTNAVPAVAAAEQNAATPATAASQPVTEPAPEEPGTMERLATSAQEVAESAVDTVTDTIKTVSAVITGSAAGEALAAQPEPTTAVAEAATTTVVAAENAIAATPTTQVQTEPVVTSAAPKAEAIAIPEPAPASAAPAVAPAPEAQIRSLAPESVAALLRRHPGKNLVVMFWEPGSDTVTASFEWLTRIQTRYGNQNLHTIAVNVAARGSTADATAIAHATNVEQRIDPERILTRAFWVQQVPSLFIVKPDGTLHQRIDGFSADQTGSYEDSVKRALRR